MNDTVPKQFFRPGFLGILLLSLFCVVVVHVFQSRARHDYRERNAEMMGEMEAEHAEAQVALREEFRVADMQRLEVQRAKWLQAVGGTVEWAAKNSEYDIQTMLEQVARASAPQGTVVSCRVDRFTEFSLFVGLDDRASTNVLLKVARDVLRHGRPYLSLVSFVREGRLVAEITQREMESVKEGQKVSDVDLSRMLFAGMSDFVSSGQVDTSTSIKVRNEAGVDEGHEEQLKRELAVALKQAIAVFDNVRDLLNEAIREHRTLSLLEGLGSVSAFNFRHNQLSDVARSIRQARARLGVASGEFRLMLEQRGFSSTLAERWAERLRGRLSPLEAKLLVALKALEDQNLAVSAYLNAMQKHFGQWTYLRGFLPGKLCQPAVPIRVP
jgi:hypothetical protein